MLFVLKVKESARLQPGGSNDGDGRAPKAKRNNIALL